MGPQQQRHEKEIIQTTGLELKKQRTLKEGMIDGPGGRRAKNNTNKQQKENKEQTGLASETQPGPGTPKATKKQKKCLTDPGPHKAKNNNKRRETR